MRPRTQYKQGFTLIEVLVTLGIVAVLIALLFPIFASARKKGRQTTCLSNLRQIGQALNMYQQDYDTKSPHMNPFWSAYNGTRPAFAGYDPLKTYGTMKGIYFCSEWTAEVQTNYNWRFQVDLRDYTQSNIPNPTFQNHKHVRLQPDSVVAYCYRHLDKGYRKSGAGFIYSPINGREGIYQILRAQGNVQRVQASQMIGRRLCRRIRLTFGITSMSFRMSRSRQNLISWENQQQPPNEKSVCPSHERGRRFFV